VLGSDDHIVDAFTSRLADCGRKVVYRHTGHRALWTRDDVRGPLCAAAPEVVLVAVGTPHGVEVAAHLETVLPHASVIAVGAGVALAVGMERRASPHLQRLRLEWAWRMATDPRRLTRRYLLQCAPLLPVLLWAARSGPTRAGSVTDPVDAMIRASGSSPSGRLLSAHPPKCSRE
jgi:exopolysaccharide biosynthesis WecB/TagA/CpsF family protein